MPRGRFVNRPYEALQIKDYLLASSIATATATVMPTMGLLPAPKLNPIQITCNIHLKKTSKSCAMDFV